jgi:inhibitor of KinA
LDVPTVHLNCVKLNPKINLLQGKKSMNKPEWPIYQPVGDAALLVVFGERIDLEINRRVHALAAALREHDASLPGLGEALPTYTSLLVHYDPLSLEYATVETWLRALAGETAGTTPPAPRLVEIPTLYGGEYGPDLAFVAEHAGLTPAEIVRRHSAVDYPVYMIGFTLGFPYLGGMDESIATPRLKTPRTVVPAGSVGIAGSQTGVYPVQSPGGWQLIGRTALQLFDPLRKPPSLLAAGDLVRFVPINQGEAHS